MVCFLYFSGLAMASNPQGTDSIVLEEEIDPNYVPSEDEVLEYAKWLGMDLVKDKDLYWVAREGLMAPLPKNWKPCKTKDTEDIYYFNFSTGESTWDHPCDGYYKRLYEEEKKKKEVTMKESNDSHRQEAKRSVEELLGKETKKKKTKTKKKTTVTELADLKAPKKLLPVGNKLGVAPLPGILSKPALSLEPTKTTLEKRSNQSDTSVIDSAQLSDSGSEIEAARSSTSLLDGFAPNVNCLVS